MKEKIRFQAGTGVTSILMVFVVLCLTTFGVLSYATARRDNEMSKKHIENMTSNYSAVSKVEEAIKEIDMRIIEQWDKELSKASNIENIVKGLELGNDIQLTAKSDNIEIIVDIDKNRQYMVDIEVYGNDNKDRYDITKYSIVPKDGGTIIIPPMPY